MNLKKAKPKGKPKRARTVKGRYKGDDKSTPDVNEAWEGGKSPKPKAKVTRVKKKKVTNATRTVVYSRKRLVYTRRVPSVY